MGSAKAENGLGQAFHAFPVLEGALGPEFSLSDGCWLFKLFKADKDLGDFGGILVSISHDFMIFHESCGTLWFS
jgi:hypothetical protein